MTATGLVLGGAILALFCSGSPNVLTMANRCDSAPCTCDSYGRLSCDCEDSAEELILSAEGDWKLSSHTTRISVSNCRFLTVANSSLTGMNNLRSVDLTNIANLTLRQQSFELSPQISLEARISVKNSSIDVLPSSLFRGNIDTISFEGVRIGQMRAFAFANINKTDTLRLKNCNVASIEAQAFKKFDVKYLHIIGGNLGDQIPSKTMNDIEVYEKFMLDGVRMGTVRSSAFIMKRPRTVAVQNCLIESLESEAFDVSARGTVVINNNAFGRLAVGAFLGFSADRETRAATSVVHFKDNSLASFEEGSLLFDRGSFRVQIDNLLVSQVCDCHRVPIWKNNIRNHTRVYARLRSAHDAADDDSENFFCLSERGPDASSVSFAQFERRSCAPSQSILVLGLALGATLLLLLALALLLAYCCRRRRRRDGRDDWTSVPTAAPDVVSNKNGVIDGRMTMVVPDGRLYKETEFHVIVEKAEPLTTEL